MCNMCIQQNIDYLQKNTNQVYRVFSTVSLSERSEWKNVHYFEGEKIWAKNKGD